MARSPCGKELVAFTQAGSPVTGRWSDTEGTLKACPDCGYLAFDPLPTNDTLAAYYGSQYWEPGGSRAEAENAYTAGANYAEVAATVRDAWAQFGPISRPAPRAHEIGCGYGATVHKLRGLGVEATGSDLSVSAVELARELGNPHTFTAPLDVFLRDRPDDPINLFLMCHSLEHIPDMRETLAQVYERLPEGGLLVLRVPNGMHATSRLRSMHEFTWLQFPDHIHYLTPRSALCLLEGVGFEVASVVTTPREEDPWMLMTALAGRTWEDLPDPSELVRALAANWMLIELQVVARKVASPRTDPALRQRAERFEQNIASMPQADLAPAQNGSGFSPVAGADTPWRWFELANGEERALQPAQGGKALVGAGGMWAMRTLMVVPVGTVGRLKRTMPEDPSGTGLAEIRLTVIQPRADGTYEVLVRCDGAEVARLSCTGKRRYSERLLVRAKQGDAITVDVHAGPSAAPVFHLHCAADWIEVRGAS